MDRYSTEDIVASLVSESRDLIYSVLSQVERFRKESPAMRQQVLLDKLAASAQQLLNINDGLARLFDTDPPDGSLEPTDLRVMAQHIELCIHAVAKASRHTFTVSIAPDVPRHGVWCPAGVENLITEILLACFGPDSAPPKLSVSMASADALRFEILASSTALAFDAGSLRDTSDYRIAGAIARKMGGQLLLPDTCDEGIRIVCEIPFCIENASCPLPPNDPHTPRILVAEDDDDSFRIIEAYLAGKGHQLVRAHDGETAVQLATAQTFDMVLMDINMPRVHGFEATRRIREWETRKGKARMPILVLSAVPLDKQRREGALVGCTGYLSKPVSKQTFLAAISQFITPATEVLH